jgi:hypothetical protein
MSAGTLSALVIAPQAGALIDDAGLAELPVPSGIDRLCRDFAEVCASAVDPLEVAAALEFDGISDQAVRDRYGLPHVFALAAEMFRRTVRRPAEPEPQPDPWRLSPLRPVLHGIIYALPAVCFPAATGLLTGPGFRPVLVVSLVASWSLSQGLAYLGYLRLGRAGNPAARRVLRAGMAAGMGLILVVLAITAVLTGPRPATLAFGAGQGAYLLGACALLVLGAERLLLLVLAPGVLASAGYLLLGRPTGLTHPVWLALAATPVLAVLLALIACGRPDSAGERLVTAAEVAGALPALAFGLLAAGLVVFPVLVADPATAGRAMLGAFPLSLSMGAAEWILHRYRRSTQRLLRSVGTLRAFARRARQAVIAAVAWYLAAAVALTVATVAVAAWTGVVPAPWRPSPEVLAYLALGGAMFVALLLQAMGERLVPLVACAAALATGIAVHGAGPAAVFAVNAALLVVLCVHAVRVLGSAMRHAY